MTNTSQGTVPNHPRAKRGAAAAAALIGLAGLTGCSQSSPPTAQSDSDTSSACPISVSDGWVKAVADGMTGAFGTLSNTSSAAVTVTAAQTAASDRMELHEVVDDGGTMVMQPVTGGFEVLAGGSFTLEPGGYHLMLMDVTAPIEAGTDVSFTLTCADGTTAEFTAQAKEFEGGDEDYQKSGSGSMPMESMAPESMAPESMAPSPTKP